MRERITLQEIVAMNNTPKAKALLVKYGYSPARSYDDLIKKLFRFTNEYKHEALEELSKIHPHKDLILSFNCNPKQVPTKEDKSNFDGEFSPYCSCPECRRMRMMGNSHVPFYSGADGSSITTNEYKRNHLMENITAIALVTALSLVFVTAMKK